MEHELTRKTADRMEGALAASDSAHPEAVGHLRTYVSMLRLPPPAETSTPRRPLARFLFKLQLGDGRWALQERELERLPSPGEEIRFENVSWIVQATEKVIPARGPAAPRPLVVCAAA